MLTRSKRFAERSERHLCADEVGMLRAVMEETACAAARLGFAANSFRRCRVRAWRVGSSSNGDILLGGSVPVEMVVMHCRRMVSHEIGAVFPGSLDD